MSPMQAIQGIGGAAISMARSLFVGENNGEKVNRRLVQEGRIVRENLLDALNLNASSSS